MTMPRLTAHQHAQLGRLARLFVVALATQLAAVGTAHLDRSALVAAVVAAAEAAWRQVRPTLPAV